MSDRGGGVRSKGERLPARGAPNEEGTAIMKLTTMTQITVDGVMQGNGGASDEDRRNGFDRGGWARGAGDDETRALITRTYHRADAFLFGGGPTSCSPAPGEQSKRCAPTPSGRR